MMRLPMVRSGALVAALFGCASVARAVGVGDPAPDFKAEAAGAGEIRLSQYRGQWVVLYFYPKADTPGCTRQSCSLRDGIGAVTDQDAVVLGVSLDNLEAQTAFRERHNLPFPLVADDSREITRAYDNLAIGGLVARRRTFIIDPQGRIAHVFDRVDVNNHAAEVAQVLQRLRRAAR